MPPECYDTRPKTRVRCKNGFEEIESQNKQNKEIEIHEYSKRTNVSRNFLVRIIHQTVHRRAKNNNTDEYKHFEYQPGIIENHTILQIKIIGMKFEIIVDNEQEESTGDNEIYDLTHGG